MKHKIFTIIVTSCFLATGEISFAAQPSSSGGSGFTIDDIQTGASDIDDAIGQVNDAISEIAGFDLDAILRGTGADSELMGCLTQNIDLTQILGQIPSVDGLCGLINMDNSLTGILDNPVAKCAGINITMPQDIQNMKERFESLCSGGSSSDSDGGGSQGDGGWGSATGNSATSVGGRVYSPVGIVVSDVESGSISGGIPTSESEKSLEAKTYPSGLTVGEVYGGDDGGRLYGNLFNSPDSADAQAIKTNNKSAIILKNMALMLNATTNENTVHLPRNQLGVMKDENDVANLISLGEVDYFELENYLIKKAREAFASLDANSLNEYYINEKQAYQEMLTGDAEVKETIATLKETAIRSIGNYYEMKLMQLKKRKDYLPNTSYTVERITKASSRDKFKLKSLLQMNDETIIKSDMAIKKREISIKIDRAIQQAYYKASIFRADIAKKEIDAILNAVDTAIH